MKKALLVLSVAALSLAALIAPVSAVPATDLGALAEYFPPETPLFFSIRTDTAFIDELDGLIETFRGNLPPGTMPPVSLRQMLEQNLSQQFGEDATLESALPWLGDTAAFGIPTLENLFDDNRANDSVTHAILALEVTDADAAAAMIAEIYEQQGAEVARAQEGEWQLLTPQVPTHTFWAFNDEVALVATSVDLLPLSDDRRSLGRDAGFSALLASLPASDYSAILALNVGDALRESYDLMLASTPNEPAMEMMRSLQPLYDNYPRQIMGFTLLDERTLAIDLAQEAFDYTTLEGPWADNLTPLLQIEPVDLSFAERVPADAPFVYLSTGLGHWTAYMIDVMATTIELGMRASAEVEEDTPAFLAQIDAQDVRAFIDLSFAGMTGLNLQREVLPYLNGTAAIYARALTAGDDQVTVDGAVVVEVTDRDATRHMYDRFVEALTQYEADFEEEDGVLVLPGVIRGLLPADTPRALLQAAELDFLIGVTDEVMAAGTRAAVKHSLNLSGPSLADNPDYQAAQAAFLPDAQTIGYIGFAPVRDLVQMMGRLSNAPDDEVAGVVAFLQTLESAAFSGVIAEDGSSVVRMTLTLAD